MTAIAPFTFVDQQVRVLVDEQGEPWFVAADVARVLGYSEAAAMTRTLDEDEKGLRTTQTLGGDQQVAVVNEAGLYSSVLRSRIPTAKAFRRWVTREVLPAIRKTGSYQVAPQFAIPQTMAEALRLAADEHERAELAEAKVAELEPKADLADTFLIADGNSRLIREVAKLIGWKERDLRRWLIEQRLVYVKHARCGDVQYDFYAAHAHHFVAKEKVIDHAWGQCSHYTLFVTAPGIELIRKRIRSQESLAVSA